MNGEAVSWWSIPYLYLSKTTTVPLVAKAAIDCPASIAALKRCATQNQLCGAAEAAPFQNQFELHRYFANVRVASFRAVPVK
jgi:hypothetical protein